LKAGAVFVMVNHTTKDKKLAYIMNDCGVRALIAQTSVAPVVARTMPDTPSLTKVVWTSPPTGDAPSGRTFPELFSETPVRPPDPSLIDLDLCMIVYTSGTTGHPKGVMLTHQNVVSTARSISTYLENTADDVVCCVLPLTFSYGLYQMFVMALVGYTLLVESSFAYPVDVLRRMEKHRVTGFPGVPGMFATMLQVVPSCNLDLSSLRYVTNAAGPMSAIHIQQILELFPGIRFFSMHGQTECARTCYMEGDRLLQKPSSIGKAMPNTELYIVDEEGRHVAPNVVGELVVRGANVMRGYWNMPEATAKKLREGPIPGEKVLYTGDLFRMDEDGDLYFVSRTDDIIKCKGEKVSPKEVEDILYEMSQIAEVGVVGVADPIDGQAIKACVVPSNSHVLTEQQIRQHCRARLESRMIPKYVEIRTSLPKTDSGKISRKDL
ncbi:MAG: AMP-binding protein, partial [Phycisphaerae bacterium]